MKVAIVGGGASGLVAGIVSARNGAKVSIYEKNNKLGKKILASGNGRCNVTNKNINISRYHGQNVEFAKDILNGFGFKECKDFFSSLGIELVSEGNKCYPASLQSSSIVEVLEYEFKSLGGEIFLNTSIDKIEKIEKSNCFCLHFKGEKHRADRVLLACGSLAMSKLGGSDDGYRFAKSFGHSITALLPSLVQLVCKEDASLASGVKIKARVELEVDGEVLQSIKKDLLFTKYGISGSSVIDISQKTAVSLHEKKDVKVYIDCLPELSKEKVVKILSDFAKKSPKKSILLILNGLINKKLALLVLKRSRVDGANFMLNKKQINTIVYNLKKLIFTPVETKGFDSAEVVSGGVDTDKVCPKTLASKLVDGLYFSGELLDIVGDCGGFNLHWAWASGKRCGQEMVKK